MQTCTEVINAETAQRYLNTSTGNRPLTPAKIHIYCKQMEEGKWEENGDTIRFDNEGHLIDGHHRLTCVVKTGIPLTTLVARGIHPSARSTIDLGTRRTFAHNLAARGVKNYSSVAGVVRAANTLMQFGRLYTNNSTRGKESYDFVLTNVELEELYERDPEGYQRMADKAVELHKKGPSVITQSWTGGIMYHLSVNMGYPEEDVFKFFEGVFSFSTSDIQQADSLRIRLTRDKTENVKLRDDVKFAFIVKAWNAYVKGNEIKMFSMSKGEEFPRFCEKRRSAKSKKR